MQAFIAIHSNAEGPAFTTFESVQEAKNYLQNLMLANKVDAADTLAIVRSYDDSIVYFKKRKNTIASLNAALEPRDTKVGPSYSMLDLIKARLTFAFTAITTAVSRW